MHLSLLFSDASLVSSFQNVDVGRGGSNKRRIVICLHNNLEPESRKWKVSLSKLPRKNVAPLSNIAVPDVGKGKCLQNDASLPTFSAIPLSSAHSEIWICKQRRGSNKRRIAIILIRRAENGWYPFPNFSAKMLHHIVIEQFRM